MADTPTPAVRPSDEDVFWLRGQVEYHRVQGQVSRHPLYGQSASGAHHDEAGARYARILAAVERDRAAVPRPAGAEPTHWREHPLVRAAWPSFDQQIAGTAYGLISERDLHTICQAVASPVAPVQGAEDVTHKETLALADLFDREAPALQDLDSRSAHVRMANVLFAAGYRRPSSAETPADEHEECHVCGEPSHVGRCAPAGWATPTRAETREPTPEWALARARHQDGEKPEPWYVFEPEWAAKMDPEVFEVVGVVRAPSEPAPTGETTPNG